MNLTQQIYTILFSTIFGGVFYSLMIINSDILFNQKMFKRIISNLLFLIDMSLVYFVILRYINYGIITYYSYIFIFLGFLCTKILINKIKTYKK